MLLALVPASLILTTVLPDELAFTMPLVLLEVPEILFCIRPHQMTIAMHFIVEPGAGVCLLIGPDVYTFSLDLVHLKVALIDGAICEGQLSSAILFALEILAFVDSVVRPGLQSVSVLLIITPSALISRTVGMSVDTLAIGFVIDPLSFVDVAVSMVELALSVCFAVAPFTLVTRPVEPFLLALTVSYPIHPISLVERAAVELDGSLLDSHIQLVFVDRRTAVLFATSCRTRVAAHLLAALVQALTTSNLMTILVGCLVRTNGFLKNPGINLLLLRVFHLFAFHAGAQRRTVSHFSILLILFKNYLSNFLIYQLIHCELLQSMGFWGFGVLGFWV